MRADIKELYDMDLGNAPYAYTPFCDSRKEMDGFRFWNSGYWRNHLQGRKYHISALYVVDLKRFRKVAAGDRLRGQYQALSQDPNSLSNLDQDLPNNMVSNAMKAFKSFLIKDFKKLFKKLLKFLDSFFVGALKNFFIEDFKTFMVEL